MPTGYLQRFINAETEEEVTELLRNIKHEHDIEWVPIGRQANNYGAVEGQASSSLGAFTELVSNSMDAILRRRYREQYGDEYDETHEIDSYEQAADILLSETDDKVTIRADGSRPTRQDRLNLSIEDPGEGQTPENFEETFVGLLEPGISKQGWPFLQGQFGMGSKAVLPHCGDNGYKLICSAGMERPGVWSWTVVRKNRAGNEYEYLTIDGGVAQRQGQIRDQTIGTVIKLYEYQFAHKGRITKTFRQQISRVITSSPFRVETVDDRYETGKTAPIHGIKENLREYSEYVRQMETVRYDFGGELGRRNVDIAILKDDETVRNDESLYIGAIKQNKLTTVRKQRNRAVFFTVNDQVHGDLGLSFIKNRCGRYHTGKDILVFVDFSDLGPAELVDLFQSSRDRLTEKPMAEALKTGMEDLITNNPTIDAEEKRRRESFTKDKREEKMGEVLEELVDRNPGLLDYLEKGPRVHKPDTDGDETVEPQDRYTAPFMPDTFAPITGVLAGDYDLWDRDVPYMHDLAVNRNGWVRFYLNAPSDFFTRDDRPGSMNNQLPQFVKSWAFNDGLLSVQLRPFADVEPGDTFPIRFTVDAEGMEPLSEEIKLEFTEPAPDESANSPSEPDAPSEKLDFPDMEPIFEDEWEDHSGEWDEHTPVQIEGTQGDMTLWINYDAEPLQDFISRYNFRKTGKEIVKETWKVGVGMYTLSTYLELKAEYSEKKHNYRQVAATAISGVCQSMLDQQISDEELESLTV